MSEATKRKNRTLSKMDKLKTYNMAEQGISQLKIATTLGITRQTVSRHLKKAGLI
ncbi:TPA: helix-turn-helix transcriptional regulator [Bacillus cereus]|nr:helix-turn-helix transcriptional regulator [Bacillus cereus]